MPKTLGGAHSIDVLALRGKSAPLVRWAADGRTLTVTISSSVSPSDVFPKILKTREALVVIERKDECADLQGVP